jgi:plastocyanin
MLQIISRNKLFIVASLVFFSLTLTGCSSYSTNAGKNSSNSPVAANTISINNFAFSPSTITVSAGTEITFINNDSKTHRPIGDSNAFDFGQLAPGQSSKQTLTQAGTFPYKCSIHPSMTGTIIVK